MDKNIKQSKYEMNGSFCGSSCGIEPIFGVEDKIMVTKKKTSNTMVILDMRLSHQKMLLAPLSKKGTKTNFYFTG